MCSRCRFKTLNFKISRCHLHTTSKNCTKVRAARAARLFFLIQPIKSLFSDVVAAAAGLPCLIGTLRNRTAGNSGRQNNEKNVAQDRECTILRDNFSSLFSPEFSSRTVLLKVPINDRELTLDALIRRINTNKTENNTKRKQGRSPAYCSKGKNEFQSDHRSLALLYRVDI